MRRERREKGCISRLFTYFLYFFAAMIVIAVFGIYGPGYDAASFVYMAL